MWERQAYGIRWTIGRITNRVLPRANDAFIKDGTVVFYTRCQHLSPLMPTARALSLRVRNVFARETSDHPTAIGGEGDDARTRFAPFFFPRIQIYKALRFSDNIKIPDSKTRASFLFLFPSPFRPASPPKTLPDRFFFLPLHRTRPLFVRGEKKFSRSFPSTRHMARCVFFSIRGARLPYLALSFFPVPESWRFGPPCPRDRPRVQRPARPIRVTNSLVFFPLFLYIHMYLRARSFSLRPLLLLPPASSLSHPARPCIGWRSSHHNAEKKIS